MSDIYRDERNEDKTHAYRKQGLTEEVIKTEKLWRIINFLSCIHMTKFVRKLQWDPLQDISRMVSSMLQLKTCDEDFRFLSKLLKCITFFQDMNQCMKISEVLGDKAKYVVNKALGEPIFTGSSEEGLALYGHENMDREVNYDRLDYRLNHDFDIMYESKKMVAQEVYSLNLQPLNASGALNVVMRPGQKAGFVTLQKCLPESVANDFKESEIPAKRNASIYPKMEQYVGEEWIALVYIQTVAFLVLSQHDFLPRECGCESAYTDGLNPNRYGDLCNDCKRDTMRVIPRGKGKTPTKIWSDSIKIRGPSIVEIAIIENLSDPAGSTAPMNETEFQEHLAQLKERRKRGAIHRMDPTVLLNVEQEFKDVFSSPERKMFYVDHVPAIKCVKWPSAAWEFTVRERPSGWPAENVIQEVVEKGCHVVPRSTIPPPSTKLRLSLHICCSTFDYMDWRISFSQAEKMLSSTFNATQVKCFLLLKILNGVVNINVRSSSDDDDEDNLFYLDSYYLKSVFFWVCEEISLEIWNDDNLGYLLFKVVNKLIMFLELATIPNYFIPSSNLITTSPAIGLGNMYALAHEFKRFKLETSVNMFKILHTSVWNELWRHSEIKPPGSSPQEMEKLLWNLLCMDFINSGLDTPEDNGQGSEGSLFDDNIEKTSKSTHDHDQCLKGVASSDSIKKLSQVDQLLAQIFLAISKFLHGNGNEHGKGINSSRAAFYEEEARKLLPEGYSLDDLPEYAWHADDSSSASSSCYESSAASSGSEL